MKGGWKLRLFLAILRSISQESDDMTEMANDIQKRSKSYDNLGLQLMINIIPLIWLFRPLHGKKWF